MKLVALTFLAAALSSPALAADPQQQPDQVHRYEKPKKPHLICRRDPSTGTRMATGRVCKTAEEWAGSTVNDDGVKLGQVVRAPAGGSGIVPTGN
jgi:hypothetical protein